MGVNWFGVSFLAMCIQMAISLSIIQVTLMHLYRRIALLIHESQPKDEYSNDIAVGTYARIRLFLNQLVTDYRTLSVLSAEHRSFVANHLTEQCIQIACITGLSFIACYYVPIMFNPLILLPISMVPFADILGIISQCGKDLKHYTFELKNGDVAPYGWWKEPIGVAPNRTDLHPAQTVGQGNNP